MELVAELQAWLGSPVLQSVALLGSFVAVIVAVVELRQNTLQSRAILLLELHREWNDLHDDRRTYMHFVDGVRRGANPGGTPSDDELRRVFSQKLAEVRDDGQRQPEWQSFTKFLTFVELLGAYVRNGYLPMSLIAQLYKGPILELDVEWYDFIKAWEAKERLPDGLLGNARYLMERMREFADEPDAV